MARHCVPPLAGGRVIRCGTVRSWGVPWPLAPTPGQGRIQGGKRLPGSGERRGEEALGVRLGSGTSSPPRGPMWGQEVTATGSHQLHIPGDRDLLG